MKSRIEGVRTVSAVVFVIAAAIAGLVAIGSPSEERARRIDARRVADLQAFVAAVDLYWTRHAEVPASLEQLVAEPGVRLSIEDPASSARYGYQVLDSVRYELCATFQRPSEAISGDPEQDLWSHGTGRQCFALRAKEIVRDRH